MAAAKKTVKPSKPSSKRRGMAKLSRTSASLVSKAVRAKGFAEAEVVTRWGRIVGQDLARATVPLKLQFPRGQRQGATLFVRTESAFAPLLLQRANHVIERVNRYLGYAAVERLEVKHGPMDREQLKAPLEKGQLDKGQEDRLTELVGEGELSPLRQAVRSLGEIVVTKPKSK